MDKENEAPNNIWSKFNNINIDDNSIIIFSNNKTVADMIKCLKEKKLPKPLAVAKAKQEEFQIILSKHEDKEIYSKSFTVVPWITQRFEYILSSSKIITKKEVILNYISKSMEAKAILEPILIDEIFTGTFKLVTDKKIEESKRKFEINNITYFINTITKKNKKSKTSKKEDESKAADSSNIINKDLKEKQPFLTPSEKSTDAKAENNSTTKTDSQARDVSEKKNKEFTKFDIDPSIEFIDPIRFKEPKAITISTKEVVYYGGYEMLSDVVRTPSVLKHVKVDTIFKVLNIKKKKQNSPRSLLYQKIILLKN